MANWFVGIVVPTGGWFQRLIADAPKGLRLFKPEDVHITVAFVGRCGEAAARLAWETAADLSQAPIEVRLGKLRGFGNPRRPSALSVVLERGHEETAALIGRLRDPMIAAAGARPDTRPPHPHITVARPSRGADARERKAAVAWAESKPAVGADILLDRLALYTWAEDRKERQFRIVLEKRLEP